MRFQRRFHFVPPKRLWNPLLAPGLTACHQPQNFEGGFCGE